MNITFSKIFFSSVVIFVFCGTAWSIEIAPRISDREIIEKLTRLEEGQKGLRLEIDQRFKAMDQRFKAVDQRFEDMEKNLDQRFDAVDQRFDDINQRFNSLESLMMIMIAGIFGLIGFVIWDRKSALRPLEKRLDKLEREIQPNPNFQTEGSQTRHLAPSEELAIQPT